MNVCARWLLSLLVVFALPLHALDMAAVIAAAERYDAHYLRAQSHFQQVSYLDDEARGALKPQLLLSHYQRYTEQDVIDSSNTVYRGGSSEFVSRTSLLRVEQVLYDRQAWQWYQRSSVEQRVHVEELRAEYQNLLLRLAEGLLHRDMAAADVELANSDVVALERLATVQRRRFEQGEAARVDYLDAQAALAAARARASEAQLQQRELQRRLQMIVGEPVAPFAVQWREFDQPVELGHWWQRAEQSSPQLIAAELRGEMARLGRRSAQGALLPKFYLALEYNRDANGDTLFGGGATVEGAAVYLRAQWDIYDGGSGYARLRRAGGEVRTAELDRELVARDLRQMLDLNLDKLSSGREQVAGYRAAVAAADELALLRQGQLQAGTIDELTYLQADRSRIEAQTQLRKSIGNYQLTSLRLLHAAGLLDASHLKALQG